MSAFDADGRAVVVCGAGAAGLAAALAAARAGAPVLLLEASTRLGGTVTHALIHTLAGLYDSAGQLIHDGLPRELTERLLAADPATRRRKMGRAWVLQVSPSAYEQTVTAWIQEEPRITVCTASPVTRIRRRLSRVVELAYTHRGQSIDIRPAAVIDATGTAEVVRLLDASLVEDDGPRAAGGLIVRLGGIAPGALEFPQGLAVVRALREAAGQGRLPADCRHAWIDVGVEPGEGYLKLFVPLADGWRERIREIEEVAKVEARAIVELLRAWPTFADVVIKEYGRLGIRDGGRVRGRYALTATDVRSGRSVAESAGRCAWPIEYWHPEHGVSVEHLPAGASYDIPLRSLQLPGLDNLWAVGKCLSADPLAHASARVVGACWAMGEAAGAAVAASTHPSVSDHRLEPVPAVS